MERLQGKMSLKDQKIKYPKLSLAMKEKWKDIGYRKKQIIAHTGIIQNSKTRKKRSQSLMGHIGYWAGKKLSIKHKKLIQLKTKQVCNTTKIRLKRAKSSRILWKNLIYANKISCSMKKKWREPGYKKRTVQKILEASHVCPNYSEKFLNTILQVTIPEEYFFVGDGQFILGGKCPDFLNINGKKKLIELFGEHWHEKKEERKRIEYFKKFGFDTLIIWGNELLNINKLKKRILAFNIL